MKTSFKTLMCALVLGSTVAIAGPDKGTSKPTTFSTGMYKTIQGKLSVNIEKNPLVPATVLIMNSKGEVLARETLSKKETKGVFRFDVSNLQDGQYQIKVVSRREVETKEFSISSDQTVTKQTITLQ